MYVQRIDGSTPCTSKITLSHMLHPVLTNPFWPMRSALLRSIDREVADIPGVILDVGCGAKPYKGKFLLSSAYIGIEIPISGHDHASSEIDVLFDGVKLPFPQDAFDCVCAFEVFEHVFDLDSLLIEIQRVLKPGGFVVISIPFLWPEHEPPYDYARYTSWGITSILESHSFIIKSISKTSGGILAMGQLLSQSIYMATRFRSVFVRYSAQLMLIFPINSTFLLLDKIFKRRDEMFLGQVIKAQLK